MSVKITLDTSSLGRENVKEMMSWLDTVRRERWGGVTILWSRTDCILEFQDESDALAFKLKFNPDKLKPKGYV